MKFFLLVTLAALTVVPLSAKPRKFDIAAQAAPAALLAFSRQAAVEVVYSFDDLKNTRTPAVTGELEPSAALDLLLRDTGFTAQPNGPGKFVVEPARRAASGVGSVSGSIRTLPRDEPIVGARVLVAGTDISTLTDARGEFRLLDIPAGHHLLRISAEPIRPSKIAGVRVAAGKTTELAPFEIPITTADGALELKEYTVDASELGAGQLRLGSIEVTGSRIRTLVGEQTLQPLVSIDRRQMERTGITTFGDIFRYIPQITTSSNGRVMPGASGQSIMLTSSTSVSASLRGFDSSVTLILINGRRAPKTGQSGTSRYDVMGMPLAAVERVEVLLDGASAIYGADAVAGVINIITRKEYQGTEVRMGYDNMFYTDAAQRSVALTHGFARGKLSGMLSLSYEDNTALRNSDTYMFRSGDRRRFGGTDGRHSTLVSGTGYVRSANGAVLPGLTSDRAAIPANSDGRTVTIADYAAAGPIGDRLDFLSSMQSPITELKSGGLNLEYKLKPWLSPYVETQATRTTIRGTTDVYYYNMSTLVLPAGYPGNPFGVPIVGVKAFFDEIPKSYIQRNSSAFTGGFRGDLPRGWRYDSAVSVVRSSADQFHNYTNLNGAAPQAVINGLNPPVLLYDSTRRTSPNPPGTLAALAPVAINSNRELPVSWTYEASADGPVWTLPAGDLRLAIGAERREEYIDYNLLVPVNNNPVTAPLLNAVFPSVKRTTSGVFAEVRAPLVSPKQQWPLLHRVEISAAARRDTYSDAPSAINPSVALALHPRKWLMLRANYTEGYKVPELPLIYRPPTMTTATALVTARTDPLRGDQVVPVPHTTVSRPNPDLKPETSRTITASMILDVPLVKGLSFSAIHWRTDYVDRITSIGTAYTFPEQVRLFPENFTRGPNLPGDLPGWPGPITSYASYSINISAAYLEGYDLAVKYDRNTRWGNIYFKADLARTITNELRTLPNLPPLASTGTFNIPMQATGSLFWTRGALDTGVIGVFRDRYLSSTSATATNYGPITRWDWQLSYDFDKGKFFADRWGPWFQKAVEGTRLSLTIFNVLNSRPPLYNGLFDQTLITDRQQHFSLQLVRRF